MLRKISASSKGEVLKLLKGSFISVLGSRYGTGSSFPGTVALDEKKLLNKLHLAWASVTTSPFSIIGGTEETFEFLKVCLKWKTFS